MIAIVQRTSSVVASATSPFTITLTGTTAGNPIIVSVHSRVSGGTLSLSDGVNTYQHRSYAANGTNLIDLFYCLFGLGGTLNFSAAYTGSVSFLFVCAREYSTTASGGLKFDGDVGCTPTSTANPATNNLTTTGSNDLLVGALMTGNSTAQNSLCTNGAGWGHFTHNTDVNAPICISEDKLNQITGTYAAAFIFNVADSTWTAFLAAFSEASSGDSKSGIVGGEFIDERLCSRIWG